MSIVNVSGPSDFTQVVNPVNTTSVKSFIGQTPNVDPESALRLQVVKALDVSLQVDQQMRSGTRPH